MDLCNCMADGGVMPIIAMPSTVADAASAVDWDATLPVSDPQLHG
jgi:hypothetical protein